MHKIWNKSLLGIEINTSLSYSSVEIDESKIISSNNEIYWMFGIVDRQTKEARIRCVLNNRTKQKLLPIVKNYIYSNVDYDNMDLDDEDISNEQISTATHIFSDCFRSYQIEDFKNLGLILKRVNHSVWFGIGTLHTNTIESLWHQIKQITNNFAGITMENLKKTFNNDENKITDYLDEWLCFALYIRETRIKKLNWMGRINLLASYLSID